MALKSLKAENLELIFDTTWNELDSSVGNI